MKNLKPSGYEAECYLSVELVTHSQSTDMSSIVSPDWELRQEPVHVNMPVFPQFRRELWGKDAMDAGREIAQSVLYSQLKPEPQIQSLEETRMVRTHHERKSRLRWEDNNKMDLGERDYEHS